MPFQGTVLSTDEIVNFFEACSDAGIDPGNLKINARLDMSLGLLETKRIVMVWRDSWMVELDASGGRPWVAAAVEAVKLGLGM